MDKLFIPQKIRVGYQNRSDTYTKRLAYVIYYDSKGVLRKEKSWEGWRDKKIKADEFENKPHSGFVLNKGVQRYGHWSSGRSMVRVYDDRGIEFEITISNLMFILMVTNCHKRGLEGDFVYAWHGTELLLLPTGCEEYQESQDFTQLQTQKIGTKDLIVGASYKTKKSEDIIYMGRFDWYDETTVGGWNGVTTRKKRPNQHIFYGKNGYRDESFFMLSGLSSLAAINSDIPVSNYAELMSKMSKLHEASPISNFIVNKVTHVFEMKEKDPWTEKWLFIKEDDGTYTRCRLSLHWNGYESKADGYTIMYNKKFTLGDNLLKEEPSEKQERNYGYHYRQNVLSPEEVNAFEFYTISVKLDNGKGWSLSDY